MSMPTAAVSPRQLPPAPALPSIAQTLHWVVRPTVLMREVSDGEAATCPAGEPFAVWPGMQSITLEVIVRAVFGVDDRERIERVAGRIRPMLDFTSRRRDFFAAALIGPERLAGARWTGFPQTLGAVHEAIDEEIALRRADPDLEGRDDILSMLVHAR